MVRFVKPAKSIIFFLCLVMVLLGTGCDQIQNRGGDGDQPQPDGAQGAADNSAEQGQVGAAENAGAQAGVEEQFEDRRQATGSPGPNGANEPQFRNPGDFRDSTGTSAGEEDDWRQNQAERRQGSQERRRTNSGTFSLDGEPQGQRIPASVAGDLTNRQLRRFGNAAESIMAFQESDDFYSRMAQVSSPEEAMRIQQEIEAEIRATIEGSGLSYQEYAGIATRLDNEPELQNRVARIIGGAPFETSQTAEEHD